MSATESNTADEILRRRLYVELKKLGNLSVAPTGNKRPGSGATVELDEKQCDELLDLGVALVEPARRALYLIEAADQGHVPVETDPNDIDALAVSRSLAKYVADVTLWRRFPEGVAMIDGLRTLTGTQIERHAPMREKVSVWLRLSDWFDRVLPIGRLRAVLAAEQVGAVLGFPPPATRGRTAVLGRDSKRRLRHQDDDLIHVDAVQ